MVVPTSSNIHALVLFSGGRDSSLAVCRLIAKGFNISLLHCNNSVSLSLDLHRLRYKELKSTFSNNLGELYEVGTTGLFREISLSNIESDMLKYQKNLICLGCKLAMHAEAIVFALKGDFQIVADGCTKYQEKYSEQRPVFLDHLREFYGSYGIEYVNPVGDCESVKQVKYDLLEYGITTKSLESTCIFGDTFSTPSDETIMSFVKDKSHYCKNFINKRTQYLSK